MCIADKGIRIRLNPVTELKRFCEKYDIELQHRHHDPAMYGWDNDYRLGSYLILWESIRWHRYGLGGHLTAYSAEAWPQALYQQLSHIHTMRDYVLRAILAEEYPALKNEEVLWERRDGVLELRAHLKPDSALKKEQELK